MKNIEWYDYSVQYLFDVLNMNDIRTNSRTYIFNIYL